jgi:hypothetical protein
VSLAWIYAAAETGSVQGRRQSVREIDRACPALEALERFPVGRRAYNADKSTVCGCWRHERVSWTIDASLRVAGSYEAICASNVLEVGAVQPSKRSDRLDPDH